MTVSYTHLDVYKRQGQKLRIGVASYLDTSVVIMEGIKAAFPEAEIVRADHIMVELRSIKTANEINCLRAVSYTHLEDGHFYL